MHNSKKILLVEDSYFIAMVLGEFLKKNGYDIDTVTTGEGAIQKSCGQLPPDIILMDIELAGEMNGIDAAQIIIKHNEIPIIFLTANASDKVIDKIRNVNAYGFLEKGMDNTSLLATIEMALKLHAVKEEIKEKETILNAVINSVRDAIVMVDRNCRVTLWNPAAVQIFGYLREEMLGVDINNILVIDHEQYNSFKKKYLEYSTQKNINIESIIELKARHKTGNLIDIEISVSSLNINEDIYIVGIVRDIGERIRARKALEDLSMTDYLTNTYNRRYFIDKLENEIKRAKRTGKEFSLAMLDIDHFKNINDRYGHNTGDLVLKCIADLIKKRIRNIDCLARWGGEEFMILLTETPINNANVLLEELRQGISKICIPGVECFTGSFGAVGFTKEDTADTLLLKADNMMYEAKAAGRNCVKYLNGGNNDSIAYW